jgi:type II secretory pathway pseudopilin PulG
MPLMEDVMSSQSQRGAVSIAVVVIVGIAALAFAALWFTTLQENNRLKESEAAANAKVEPTEAKLAFAESAYGELAKVIGPSVPSELPKPDNWDKRGAVFPSDPLVLGQKVEALKTALKGSLEEAGDKSTVPTDLKHAFDALLNAHKALQTNKVTVLESSLKEKETEIATLNTRIQEAEQRGATDLAALNTEKDNATARLQQQLSEANAQRDEAQGQNRKLTEEINNTKETSNKEVLTAKSQMRILDAQVSAMKSDLRTQRETDVPDGRILAVNHGMKTAWIDLGGKHQLRRGTVFKVFETLKPGEKVYKGRVVVTNVSPESSEVAIESEQPGTSVATSDVIVNPVFDKARATRFFILGELTGRANVEMAKRVLTAAGAKVDEKLSVETDFLVLGVKESPDSPELTDSEAYKQAQAWGIEIIRARDLDPFLTY